MVYCIREYRVTALSHLSISKLKSFPWDISIDTKSYLKAHELERSEKIFVSCIHNMMTHYIIFLKLRWCYILTVEGLNFNLKNIL